MLKAAAELVESSLYGGRPTAQRKLDRLQTVTRLSHRLNDHGANRLLTSAGLMALVRADKLVEAHETALHMEASWPHPLDSEIPIDVILAFDASITEAHIGAGDSLSALRWATRLAGHVLETHDARWHYRSSGLVAAALAFNGEWDRVEQQLAAGQRIAAEAGWDTHRADYMHAVAEALLAFMTADPERAAALVPRVRALEATEPTARALTDIVNALAMMLRGEDNDAMHLGLRIQQGITQPDGAAPIHEFAKYLQAFVLLRQRDPLRALSVMRESVALGNHMLCPNVIRSVALLQMQDYRGALAETNACMRIRSQHSLWFFPFALLCRSIAQFKLGDKALALRTATLLNKHGGMEHLATALEVCPVEVFTEFIDYIERRTPRFVFDFSEIRNTLATVSRAPQTEPKSAKVQLLTKRERFVASNLNSRLSLIEIAQQLQVSPSTITSQAVSIYRKLEVAGRDEAIQYLDEVGFFEV